MTPPDRHAPVPVGRVRRSLHLARLAGEVAAGTVAAGVGMDFVAGLPVDQLMRPGVPQAQRDRVAGALCKLAVQEFFRMRLVQTDPNFGNYLFDAPTGRVALLDFGATEAARKVGVIGHADSPAQAAGVLDLLMLIGQPLQAQGVYDFGASDLIAQAFQQGQAQVFGEGHGSAPPADLLFLQRKFAGTFMLCRRLGARLDLNEVFGEEL